jgi:transcriptional regulator with XRE-family HTH domain
MKIGKRIRLLRKKLGITQAELASRLETDGNTVSRWERDKLGVRSDNLSKLAVVLNTSVAYLIGETDNPLSPCLLPASAVNTAIVGDNNGVNVAPIVNTSGTASSSQEVNSATQKTIIITVGDLRIEFPGDTSSDVIARAIESAQSRPKFAGVHQ